MATKVRYIIVGKYDVLQPKEVENLMMSGGEIMKSWVAGEYVHHLIKYEEKDPN